jgi:hypothetical protein
MKFLSSELAYRQTVLQAFADVANSLVGYEKSRSERLTLDEQTATYAETARLANDRYRKGAAPASLKCSLPSSSISRPSCSHRRHSLPSFRTMCSCIKRSAAVGSLDAANVRRPSAAYNAAVSVAAVH